MRPTRSKDGAYRVDVRSEHRLGGREFAILLAAYVEPDLVGTDLTRAAAANVVHNTLQRQGISYLEAWTDFIEPEDMPFHWRWACTQVARLWPPLAEGLDPAEYDDWAPTPTPDEENADGTA